jgi:DNA-binding NarL/FixJ family response regulator
MLAPPERRTTHVVVVDDHDIVREGLGGLLSDVPSLEVVGYGSDGAEAIELATELRPDVVLMDLQMPGMDGVEATRRIAARPAAPAVLVLTSFSDHARVTEALDAGAAGYLLKDSEPEEIVAGIFAAAHGGAPLAPRVARRFVRERRDEAAGDELTDREREILELVADGADNRQIAVELGISDKTVKTHLTHAFRHIGVRDRLEAARWVRRHGLSRPG